MANAREKFTQTGALLFTGVTSQRRRTVLHISYVVAFNARILRGYVGFLRFKMKTDAARVSTGNE